MVRGQVAVFIFVISIVSKPGRGGWTVKKENDVSDKKEEALCRSSIYRRKVSQCC